MYVCRFELVCHYATRISQNVIRFPLRRVGAIIVCQDRDGDWLTLVNDHGWSHGSFAAAYAEAAWLSANYNLPIRSHRGRA